MRRGAQNGDFISVVLIVGFFIAVGGSIGRRNTIEWKVERVQELKATIAELERDIAAQRSALDKEIGR